jgi:hypothetical protein
LIQPLLYDFQVSVNVPRHGQGETMDYQEAEPTNHEFEAVSTAVRGVNVKLIATVLAIAYMCGSGYYVYHLGTRLEEAENSQKTVLDSVEMRNKAIADQLENTE